MWKNVFAEVLILSILIFGGFYINATILKKEIATSQENLLTDQKDKSGLQRLHFSGQWFDIDPARQPRKHVSGGPFETGGRPSISGASPPLDSPEKPGHLSGNNA